MMRQEKKVKTKSRKGLRERMDAWKYKAIFSVLNMLSPIPCFASDPLGIDNGLKSFATILGSVGGVVGIVMVAIAGWKVISGNIDHGKEKIIHAIVGVGIITSAASICALFWGISGAVI